jgi:hypothetical protein
VIASQLNKQWPPSKQLLLGNPYFDKYPELKERCSDLSEPEELAALAWCMRYHSPLTSDKPYPFILICYEKLVRNGADELKRLVEAWGLPADSDISPQLSRPSDTSTNHSNVVHGKDPLAGWCDRLTPSQIENILAVLRIFEMDFYTAALEPDYRKLAHFAERPAMSSDHG